MTFLQQSMSFQTISTASSAQSGLILCPVQILLLALPSIISHLPSTPAAEYKSVLRSIMSSSSLRLRTDLYMPSLRMTIQDHKTSLRTKQLEFAGLLLIWGSRTCPRDTAWFALLFLICSETTDNSWRLKSSASDLCTGFWTKKMASAITLTRLC